MKTDLVLQRQSMHVASVAANAIVELFRDSAVSRAGDLHREIPVFSISHDRVNVKIHGHYACIEGDKITLHHHLIRSFDFRDQKGKEKWTTYHIVRKIYDYFAPVHHERIRSAIAQLSIGSSFGISSASRESNHGVDQETKSDSQDMAEGAPLSKGTDWTKKQRLKPIAMLQQGIEWLSKEREESNQRLAGFMELLKEQKEDNERQRQEMEQRKDSKKKEERMERQRIERQKEIISLSKASKRS